MALIIMAALISIIIPAYNEEAAIGAVIRQIQALALDAEIVVVDDGSTDATAQVAHDAGARVVRHAMNRGYGRSVKDGVAYAQSDVILVTDADGTYPIDHLPMLLQRFEEGVDMVVGARQGKTYRGSPMKWAGRLCLQWVVEYATGRNIPDVNSGMRVFRKKDAMPYFPDICDGFSFTTTITLVYMLTHLSVAYVPVPYHKRVGHSKVRMLRDSLRTLQYVTECIVRYNPLKLYLPVACMTVLLGAAFFPWSGAFGLLITLCSAAVVLSIGFLAETLRRPRR